jgi:hypothetical protein
LRAPHATSGRRSHSTLRTNSHALSGSWPRSHRTDGNAPRR